MGHIAADAERLSIFYNKDNNPAHPGLISTMGVTNINVTNLDSFLNMDYFIQTLDCEEEKDFEKKYWKLYVNGKQVHDISYPEGSPVRTSMAGAEGINSITIPASDTARIEPMVGFNSSIWLFDRPLAIFSSLKKSKSPKV